MACSCKVPKWAKAVRASVLAVCRRCRVPAAAAQTCRGGSGRGKVGPVQARGGPTGEQLCGEGPGCAGG